MLVVAGGPSAAELARSAGAEVLVEEHPEGQNQAARRGLDRAAAAGASAVLLLSSDLPLVTRAHVARLLADARSVGTPAVVAAPATGRGGTNALYLSPPDAIGLHFGDDSLRLFEAAAAAAGVTFRLHESSGLALDLDEPADLRALPG